VLNLGKEVKDRCISEEDMSRVGLFCVLEGISVKTFMRRAVKKYLDDCEACDLLQDDVPGRQKDVLGRQKDVQ